MDLVCPGHHSAQRRPTDKGTRNNHLESGHGPGEPRPADRSTRKGNGKHKRETFTLRSCYRVVYASGLARDRSYGRPLILIFLASLSGVITPLTPRGVASDAENKWNP